MVENTHFDNDGNIRIFNRAERRRKPLKPRFTIVDYINVPDNALTKATHKIKKLRKKNAKSNQQRIRAIANARKARKEAYSQHTEE